MTRQLYTLFMMPSPISIKNVVERLNLLSLKRINSHNLESEVKNEKTSIGQQFNNPTFNYCEHKPNEIEEKVSDEDQREAIFIDPIAFDPSTREIWNKVF